MSFSPELLTPTTGGTLWFLLSASLISAILICGFAKHANHVVGLTNPFSVCCCFSFAKCLCLI